MQSSLEIFPIYLSGYFQKHATDLFHLKHGLTDSLDIFQFILLISYSQEIRKYQQEI